MSNNSTSDYNSETSACQDELKNSPQFSWPALQKALKLYQEEKLRYFPIPWGKKGAVVEWGQLRYREATQQQLAQWFREDNPTNVAIICGEASNGLLCLCFNDPSGASLFFGSEHWEKLRSRTFVVETSRGHHVYLRPKVKIETQYVAKDGAPCWLEIRGDSVYVAAPPSLHPSGTLYKNIGIENIARANRLDEFITERLSALGLKARLTKEDTTSKQKTKKEAPKKQTKKFNELAVAQLLNNCAFIQHCRDSATTLSEPYWWAMIHNLVVFGEPGREKIHELSAPYPGYTEEETDRKIEEAVKAVDKEVSPQTCEFIEQSLGFDCPDDCLAKQWKAKAPAGLAHRLVKRSQKSQLRWRYLITDEDGKITGVDIKLLADDLMDEFTFKTYKDTEEILVYDSGRYTNFGEQTIKQECQNRVGLPYMTTNKEKEIIAAIQQLTYTPRSDFNQGGDLINLKNGLLNWKTGEFIEGHTPDYLSTIQLPVEYDPSANCPQVGKFLSEVVAEADIPLIYEIFGNCLVADSYMMQAVLFIGEGAGGKSTALGLLKALLGAKNCSAQSLFALEYGRFATAAIEGKLANVFADLPAGRLERSSIFKMLTGGAGDSVPAEEKFKQPHDFTNHAKLLFSSNKPPTIKDDTYAFWRRWIMIKFPHKFEGDNEDKDKLKEITAPSELSGLLNLSLKGLRRLRKQGKFSYNKKVEEVAQEYKKAAEPAWAFINEYCDFGEDLWISHGELYVAYCKYCQSENIPDKGTANFSRDLTEAIADNNVKVHKEDRRPKDAKYATKGWAGMQLNVEYFNCFEPGTTGTTE